MTAVRTFLELLVVLAVHEFGHGLVAYVLRMPISSMTIGDWPEFTERVNWI
jgi:membrane-associated protease RseP (regulator of RpoE activity)